MKAKRFIALLLAVLLCFALFGCGGGGESQTTTPAPTEATEAGPDYENMSMDELYELAKAEGGTITVADALSVRRAAGDHARLLHRLVQHLNLTGEEKFEAEWLRERLGHNKREVFVGVLFGIAVAIAVCGVWDFWK